jgi:predicted  nucleic acid-binding Zn-ribbon protein
MEAVSFEPRLDKINQSIRSLEDGMNEKTSEPGFDALGKIKKLKAQTAQVEEKLSKLQDITQEHLVLLKNDIDSHLRDIENDLENISKK